MGEPLTLRRLIDQRSSSPQPEETCHFRAVYTLTGLYDNALQPAGCKQTFVLERFFGDRRGPRLRFEHVRTTTDVPVEGLSLSTGASLAVAVGTLLLAAFTAFLAYETRRVAGDTEEDVTAQWRPVVIAARTSLSVRGIANGSDGEVSFTLVNTGQGPAINTAVTVVSESSAEKRESPESQWGTLAVGQEHDDTFQGMLLRDSSGGQRPLLRYTITARYADLADRVHHTVLTGVDSESGARGAPGEELDFEVRIADTKVAGPPRSTRVPWRPFKRPRPSA